MYWVLATDLFKQSYYYDGVNKTELADMVCLNLPCLTEGRVI